MFHIKQTAVHGDHTGTFVMHVDITILVCLAFLFIKKELPVHGLFVSTKDQCPFGGYQVAVGVGIAPVDTKQHLVSLPVYFC